MSEGPAHRAGIALLSFGTLGIVFGDIGTSPIYAFRETFHHAELEVSTTTAFGAASVAFWALIVVISLKYLLTVMRADNHGEGGILALTSLAIPPEGQAVSRIAADVVTLGVKHRACTHGERSCSCSSTAVPPTRAGSSGFRPTRSSKSARMSRSDPASGRDVGHRPDPAVRVQHVVLVRTGKV